MISFVRNIRNWVNIVSSHFISWGLPPRRVLPGWQALRGSECDDYPSATVPVAVAEGTSTVGTAELRDVVGADDVAGAV